VNFASRIEARAKSNQILLSQSTAARVEMAVQVTATDEIDNIKNIPGKFKLFSV
jgi:class 3 adenylate cyclase